MQTEFGVDLIDYCWTNEDYESMDGMPFVGRASPQPITLRRDRIQRVGITNGTAAGMIICDLISGRDNPWAQVFDATRMKPLAGAKRFISENVGTGAELVSGYLKGSGARRRTRPPRGRRNREAEGRAHRRVSRRARAPPCGLGGVHSHGMRAGLECGRPDLGLLVPRPASPSTAPFFMALRRAGWSEFPSPEPSRAGPTRRPRRVCHVARQI